MPYRVFLLRKRAIFPLKVGRQTLEPVEVDVSTGFGLMLSGRKVHRASAPLTLDVEPLPPGAPSGFSSANVGQWRLSSEATPTAVPLGQPLTFKVVLEGTGNLHDVAVPRLPPVPGFKKIYDPTTSEKVATAKARFGGRRTLEYLMMPEQTGTFELPALSLAFFNPSTRVYQTASTQPVSVRVDPGSAPAVASAGAGTAPGAPADRAVNVLGSNGLRPLRYKAELSRPAPPLWRKDGFAWLAASPLALWAGLAGAGFFYSALTRKDPEGRQAQGGQPSAAPPEAGRGALGPARGRRVLRRGPARAVRLPGGQAALARCGAHARRADDAPLGRGLERAGGSAPVRRARHLRRRAASRRARARWRPWSGCSPRPRPPCKSSRRRGCRSGPRR